MKHLLKSAPSGGEKQAEKRKISIIIFTTVLVLYPDNRIKEKTKLEYKGFKEELFV